MNDDFRVPTLEPARACKRCGRQGEEMPRRGPYASLCAGCRKQRGAEIGSGAGVRAHHQAKREAGDADSFEARAKSLVSYGRRVDRALADVRLTANGLNDAKTLAREALEQWKTACLRLAGVAER